MNMDVMSAGNYSRNYTNTNTTKSTATASFADAMAEQTTANKREYGDETMKHVTISENPAFAEVMSYEEIMKDWEEQVKANHAKNAKSLAEVMLEIDPNARQKMYGMVGSPILYTFDEYVKHMEEQIRKLSEK